MRHHGGIAVAAVMLIALSGCGAVTGTPQRQSGAPAPAAAGDPGDPAGMAIPSASRSIAPAPSSPAPGSAAASSVPAGGVPVSPPAPLAPSSPAGPHAPVPGTVPAGSGTLAAEFSGAAAADPSDYRGSVTAVGFSSPSGNITCGFHDAAAADGSGLDGVICQIQTFDFQPAIDCHGQGSGGALTVGLSGPPRFSCAGDVESGGPPLAYGASITADGVRCVSRADGVSCLGVGSGDGFRIARGSYLLEPETSGSSSGAAGTSDPGTAAPAPGRPSVSSVSSVPSVPSVSSGPGPGTGTSGDASPAGHVFWTGNVDDTDNTAGVIGFVDDRWAFVGGAAGIPTCAGAGTTADGSAMCLPYTFDAATGTAHLGPGPNGKSLDGTYRDGVLTLDGMRLKSLAIPPAGTRLTAQLYSGYARGTCGAPGGCAAGSLHVDFRSDGTVTISGGAAAAGGVFGSIPPWSSNDTVDGVVGSYRILDRGRLRLTVKGTATTILIGEVLDGAGSPDPNGAKGNGGLVLGSVYLWHDRAS